MKIRGILLGVVSFAIIYFVPFVGRLIESLIRSVPMTAATKGVVPAVAKVAIALALWLLLYQVFVKSREKPNSGL